MRSSEDVQARRRNDQALVDLNARIAEQAASQQLNNLKLQQCTTELQQLRKMAGMAIIAIFTGILRTFDVLGRVAPRVPVGIVAVLEDPFGQRIDLPLGLISSWSVSAQ